MDSMSVDSDVNITKRTLWTKLLTPFLGFLRLLGWTLAKSDKSFEYGKCPETEEMTKSLAYRECLEKGEISKSLEFTFCADRPFIDV